MLGVGPNLRMVKFFMQHLWMLHDFVVVWPGSSNNVAQGIRTSSIFNTQHVRRNTSEQDGQTHATCCAQQLSNAEPTMLGYVVLKWCDRFVGASDSF